MAEEQSKGKNEKIVEKRYEGARRDPSVAKVAANPAATATPTGSETKAKETPKSK